MDPKTPNRSFYHWLVVASCCMLACGSVGIIINCAGIFYPTVAKELGVGQGDISLYSTIVNLFNGLMGPVVAVLMKKINFRLMVGSGIVMLACGLISLSFANSPLFFYIAAPFIGFGTALAGTLPIAAVISNWFTEKYGLASGIAMSFSGVGGALITPLLSGLIASIGWRNAYIASGILSMVLTLPGIIFVMRLRPEEKGLVSYGSVEAPAAEAAGKKSAVSGSVFRSPVFFAACLFGFLASAVTAMGSHFPGYAGELGLASAAGALMVSACMAGNISGKLILGVLSDAVGPFKACLIMFGVNAAALVGLTVVPVGGSVLPMLMAFFFGAIYSVAAVGVALVTKKLYGPEHFSIVLSYVTMTSCIGSAVMITTAGYIFDFFRTYRVATALFAVCAAVGMVLAVYLSRKAPKNK